MRLWTLHPKYLDRQGLLALWREALLAQQVLHGQTRGYRDHPQLLRFRSQSQPLAALAAYLLEVHAEAVRRGYSFNANKINAHPAGGGLMSTTLGQLQFEWEHLLGKLRSRSPGCYEQHLQIRQPLPHPMFYVVPGPVA